MKPKLDPDLEKILPLLPLRDAATLTPERARAELVALAEVAQGRAAAGARLRQGHHRRRRRRPDRRAALRAGKTPAPTIVYFHGGGWVAGDLFTHERQARTLALELEAVVVSVDYRRPPETPFPGAFEDCLAATRWAAANVATLGGDAARLAVAGDSAGGNLAAAVAQASRDGGPRLAAQFLIYPATDLLGRYGVAAENAKYPVAPGERRGLLPDRRCHALLCRPLPAASAGQRGSARLAAAQRRRLPGCRAPSSAPRSSIRCATRAKPMPMR